MTSDSVANVSSIRLRRWLSDLIEGSRTILCSSIPLIDPVGRIDFCIKSSDHFLDLIETPQFD